MNPNAPIPLAHLPHFEEGTALASDRDNRNPANSWKKERTTVNQLNSAMVALQRTVRGLARQKRVIYGGGGNAVSVQQFTLVSDGGDYYNCYSCAGVQWNALTSKYDPVSPGSSIVKVAKDQDLMCILPTASPSGGAWPVKTKRGNYNTYVYNQVGGSTADGVNVIEYTRNIYVNGSVVATSSVTPVLNVGDVIFAVPFAFHSPATVAGVQWLALAAGRAFADPYP